MTNTKQAELDPAQQTIAKLLPFIQSALIEVPAQREANRQQHESPNAEDQQRAMAHLEDATRTSLIRASREEAKRKQKRLNDYNTQAAELVTTRKQKITTASDMQNRQAQAVEKDIAQPFNLTLPSPSSTSEPTQDNHLDELLLQLKMSAERMVDMARDLDRVRRRNQTLRQLVATIIITVICGAIFMFG